MIAACLKWVDHRPEVDPLTGAVHTDVRTSGPSDLDLAALEVALRLGEALGVEVVAVTAGPPTAEAMLRDALAAGASRAVRVDLAVGATSEAVAASVAVALPDEVAVVVCGAWSTDRGSGAVPAFLAAHRGAAQALGLTAIDVRGADLPDADLPAAPLPGHDASDAEAGPVRLEAERRLDGGRRERLAVPLPAVVSVEAFVRLRRAPLGRVLAAADQPVDTVPAPVAATAPATATRLEGTAPFQPRSRRLAAPSAALSARERILALTGALVDRDPPRVVHLDPAAAADELLAQLEAWGYR